MPIHEFLAKKAELYHGLIPEYRFFTMEEVTKDIIWKIVMTRRNAIVCLDTRGEVVATIGLMELFSLYVQEGPGTHKSSSDTAAGTETS